MDTPAIIKKAAFDLFLHKKFKDITVQDIIDRAKCSRYSFYRYFQDKYELMRLYYTNYVTKLLLHEYNGDNYPKIQEKIFQFILDNISFFENIKDFRGDDSFWSFLESYAKRFFTEIKYLNLQRQTLTDEEHYEMIFVVNGALCVFRNYVEELPGGLSPKSASELLCAHYPEDYYILPENKLDEFRESFSRCEK